MSAPKLTEAQLDALADCTGSGSYAGDGPYSWSEFKRHFDTETKDALHPTYVVAVAGRGFSRAVMRLTDAGRAALRGE